MTVLSAIILLFFVMDPLGNVPLFLVALKEVNSRRRKKIIIRESLIASNLHRLLGQRMLVAIERLMGMLLTTIAVQMFLTGIGR